MSIGEIIELLKEYLFLGIIAIAIFLIGYQIIYKRIMKGTKTISKSKFVLYGTSIVYIVVVIGATFLSRSNGYGTINLHLFSSYRQAYNQMQISLFRNIILNILLFVPLGFLVPFYLGKLKKSYITILIGFGTTLVIEIIQYITNMGIFEIDDVFNNTVGTIIGYCIFMICKCLWTKENRKMIIVYLLPIVITVLSFLGIYINYESQEFGNLHSEYNYKVNMKNIKVESKIDLSDDTKKENIYYTKILAENETKEIAKNLFEYLGTSIDESRTIIYEDEAIYYSKDHHSIWVKYKGGTYNYTNFDIYSQNSFEEVDINETSSEGTLVTTNNKDIQIKGAKEEEIKSALQKLGIVIPENAEFKENENGQYVFKITMSIEEDSLLDGEIKLSYYENQIISNLTNNLLRYNKIAEKEIISENEAYQEILEGKFQYDTYNIEKLENIIIEDVDLDYSLDSKGYYVPVYVFKTNMNSNDRRIVIKALR